MIFACATLTRIKADQCVDIFLDITAADINFQVEAVSEIFFSSKRVHCAESAFFVAAMVEQVTRSIFPVQVLRALFSLTSISCSRPGKIYFRTAGRTLTACLTFGIFYSVCISALSWAV
jgi:hypothetical protein